MLRSTTLLAVLFCVATALDEACKPETEASEQCVNEYLRANSDSDKDSSRTNFKSCYTGRGCAVPDIDYSKGLFDDFDEPYKSAGEALLNSYKTLTAEQQDCMTRESIRIALEDAKKECPDVDVDTSSMAIPSTTNAQKSQDAQYLSLGVSNAQTCNSTAAEECVVERSSAATRDRLCDAREQCKDKITSACTESVNEDRAKLCDCLKKARDQYKADTDKEGTLKKSFDKDRVLKILSNCGISDDFFDSTQDALADQCNCNTPFEAAKQLCIVQCLKSPENLRKTEEVNNRVMELMDDSNDIPLVCTEC